MSIESVPDYILTYQFQETAKDYVRRADISKLNTTVTELLVATCAVLYQVDETHMAIPGEYLVFISGFSNRELARYDYQSIFERYNKSDEFISSIMTLTDVIELGYYDGWEWKYWHYLQTLVRDSKLLDMPSLATFYEYTPNPEQFKNNAVYNAGSDIIHVLYPTCSYAIYDTVYNCMSMVNKTFDDWSRYYSSLDELLSNWRDYVGDVERQKAEIDELRFTLGIRLMTALCLMGQSLDSNPK